MRPDALCRRFDPWRRARSGGPQEHDRTAKAVRPLWLAHSSDEDGAERVQATGSPQGNRGEERHMRLPGVDAFLDAITPGVRGDQAEDSPETPPSPHEVSRAVVAPQPSCPLEKPVSEALPEVAWALPVRRDARQLPPAGGHLPVRGEDMAILAESAQSSEREPLGEVPAAAGKLSPAHTQDRPQHLIGHAG